MSRERRRYLFAGTLTVLLVLSACKYFDDFTISPSEAASAVLRGVSNESRFYNITEEQKKGIEDLYESAEKLSLPHFEVTKVISMKKDEWLERVIFKKDSLNQRWIMVPKKIGDSDTNYINRNSNGNYLLQDIRLESKENLELEGFFKVIAKINYSEFNEGSIINKYTGWVTFMLKKLSVNHWSVEEVYAIPFIQENCF
jgi:hypothetical protein